MNKTVLLGSWLGLAIITSVVWFLRFQNPMLVGMALVANIIGLVLPIFLDILLPRLMSEHVSIDQKLATDVLKEGMGQVRQGNVHTSLAPKTPLRSYPLLAAFFLTSFFIITSTGNFFGRGFVIGLGVSLVTDLWLSRKPLGTLKERWFSVFNANFSDKEFEYFVYGSVGIFAILLLLALFV